MAGDINDRILKSIRERAESYTPEWRFDMENPDIGSALAVVFGRMASGTIKRFSKIPMKNRIAFLNALHTSLLPAVPSHGYVQFFLIHEEAEGALVEAGQTVLANNESVPDGQVHFETKEDVYVTPAAITDIYQTDDRCDTIFELYDRQRGAWKTLSLFSADGINLQEHEMYFSHRDALGIRLKASIEITCFRQDGISLGADEWQALADTEKAVFEYYSSAGWTSFESQEITDEGLIFYKGRCQPPFVTKEIEGEESYWLRCRILCFKTFAKMHFEKFFLSPSNEQILPDMISGTMEEYDRHRCFPFGEQPYLYQEVYFASEEALSKKGARIIFSYSVHFVKIPSDDGIKEKFQWEWVMKQSDLKKEPEYDITIESVVWEYYNGTGWTRLFTEEGDNKNGRAFSDAGGGEGSYRKIEFLCPEDIEKTLVNAEETYWIRARILKMNHLYKPAGIFVVPCMENISFRYSYQKHKLEPQKYIFRNNLENCYLSAESLRRKKLVTPFYQTGEKEAAVYFGFETPPVGSPIKILFCIAEEKDRSRYPFFWEYWNGEAWKNINPIDETEYFSRTGIVSFAGNRDMARKRLFGKERYWLRILAAGWKAEDCVFLPLLQKICMNATTVRNIYRRQKEYFQMEVYKENIGFDLLEKNIFEAGVFVDEKGYLSEQEIQMLEEENALFREIDESGMEERMWVKWTQVADFSDSSPIDRHFVLEEADGILLFGNGQYGKIPYLSEIENIFIEYSCGGGAYTNLPMGEISQMSISIGYIGGVTNPLAMTGGCDVETMEAALHRASAAIRHQNLAVSIRDFEELAMCASRDIRLVKCFAGYDEEGMPLNGAVTLVVLKEQFLTGQMQFSVLKEALLEYMKKRISVTLLNSRRFFVVPPKLVEIRLRITLDIENFQEAFRVRREILSRMERFFTPAGRETQTGWEIGQFPDVLQIQNALNDITGIVHIRSIMMSTYVIHAGAKSEVDIGEAKSARYVLPVNGKHEIIISA